MDMTSAQNVDVPSTGTTTLRQNEPYGLFDSHIRKASWTYPPTMADSIPTAPKIKHWHVRQGLREQTRAFPQ